jgi:hypothetical protein
MSDAPPSDPEPNAVWVDAAGELKYFDGSEWVLYPDVPDGDLPPNLVTRIDGTSEE